MIISEKKRQDLYGTIHEEIMKLRINIRLIASKRELNLDALDDNLADCVERIWKEQKKVLRFK